MTRTRDARGRFAKTAPGTGSRAGAVTGAALPPPVPTGAVRGGRISLDNALWLPGGGAPFVILPPPDANYDWSVLRLETATLGRMPAHRLVETLADLSPEMSRAHTLFLRLANPGYTIVVRRPGSPDPWPQGQARLDAFLAQLTARHGALDVIMTRLFAAHHLRGALLAELVLDEAGRAPLDLAVPDPQWVRFRRRTDPTLGVWWELGQYQGANFVSLDAPTIRYIPNDPFPGSPYGRAPVAAGVYVSLFLISLLFDVGRVMAQQGLPRLDITVDLAALKDIIPQQVWADPQRFKAWGDAIMNQVADAYAKVGPDEAYVHSHIIAVNGGKGTADATSLGGATQLIDRLERIAARALQTSPLMMGLADGTSEANANRQWEIVAATVKAAQHPCEQLLEYLFGLALRIQGMQADVEVRFAELRTAELLRDAQVANLQTLVAYNQYQAGWISQDQAAHQGAGVDKADAAAPRGPLGGGGGHASPLAQAATENPDAGSARQAPAAPATRAVPDAIPPTPHAALLLDPVPATTTLGPGAEARLRATWAGVFGDTEFAALLDARPEDEE